ncbi:MAG: sulfite exporter TauE/SafE family protein [Gammaproteobacteria bacterium]|nr:sulfite exporter TauE/SafE family protein [Gammaproteobacteria bacterium]
MGLFGSLHCISMCGSIAGVLSFSLPQKTRCNPSILIGYLGIYNLGRLCSYSIAGALAGAFGSQLLHMVSPEQGHLYLLLAASAMMIAVGLYLAGWFPGLSYVEKIGIPVWRKLEPLGRKLLPVKSPFQAFLYGMVWGWLPCGLVYSALLLALSQGNTLQGVLLMFVFGLGTLPSVIGTGVFAATLLRYAQNPKIRAYSGILLITLALLGLVYNLDFHEHLH